MVVGKDGDGGLTGSVRKVGEEKGVEILVVDWMKKVGKGWGIEVGGGGVGTML